MKNNSDAPALGAPAAGSRDRSSTAVAPASVRGVHPTTTVVCRCASHVLAQTDAERTWRPRPRAQGECNVPSQGQLGSKIGRKSASSADNANGANRLEREPPRTVWTANHREPSGARTARTVWTTNGAKWHEPPRNHTGVAGFAVVRPLSRRSWSNARRSWSKWLGRPLSACARSPARRWRAGRARGRGQAAARG